MERKDARQAIEQLEKTAIELQLELSRTLRLLERSRWVIGVVESKFGLDQSEESSDLGVIQPRDK